VTGEEQILSDLLGEAADQVELWSDRAEYWRSVAIEFAAGRRDPYQVPSLAGHRLREAAPKRMDWGAPQGADEHPLVADLRALRYWWTSGERPLGRIEVEQ
jgi:hypothetical protein